jgi:hypothetical protein
MTKKHPKLTYGSDQSSLAIELQGATEFILGRKIPLLKCLAECWTPRMDLADHVNLKLVKKKGQSPSKIAFTE